MQAQQHAIEIEGLSFTYAGARDLSLDQVNLELRKGEIAALIGPTGAGKSTLYSCLMGLIPQITPGRLSGSVRVAGMDTRQHSIPELAQRIGIVFQDPEVQLFSLTVEEELAFGPQNLGLPRQEIFRRVSEIATVIELESLLDKEPARLSGGQKQTVALGSVLTMLPDILILDEPTSNLDPEGTRQVLSLVERLNREHSKTILIAEHKIDEVARFADQVFVMHEGRLVLDGSPRSVFGRTDILHRLGLVAPGVTELALRMRQAGANIEPLPVTLEEAVETFRHLLEARSRA